MRRVLLALLGLIVVSACAPSTPPPPPTPAPPPARVPSPDYGLHVFVWGHPQTTDRDLKLASDLGAHWQKSLFEWRSIEKEGKGQFDWREADRVVKATAAAGLKTIARLDFQPEWARAQRPAGQLPGLRRLRVGLRQALQRHLRGRQSGRHRDLE
jgi:hypothetical protein